MDLHERASALCGLVFGVLTTATGYLTVDGLISGKTFVPRGGWSNMVTHARWPNDPISFCVCLTIYCVMFIVFATLTGREICTVLKRFRDRAA